jgi:hypothetical protein
MRIPRSRARISALTRLMLRLSAEVIGARRPLSRAAKRGLVVFAEARAPS